MKLLTTLPPEILLDISEHLDAFDLVQLSRTCPALHHLSDCKCIAKAFMRHGSAEHAIHFLTENVDRVDLIVELFRHVEDRTAFYPCVAEIAARLNDLTQLQVWHTEFGFIPPSALIGAVRSDRIETFDFVMPHVRLENYIVDSVFECVGNKTMLDQFRTKYPEWVTPERIQKAVVCSAHGDRFDFALEVFRRLPPRNNTLINYCAGQILVAAAEHGNTEIFTQFISMIRYDDIVRDDIAIFAARGNHVAMLRLQEDSNNFADSLGQALFAAVEHNSMEAFQVLLEIEQGEWARISGKDLVEAFLMTIDWQRTAMVPIIMAHAPREALL